MSQLYVPDKVWLVCSDGMKKSQLKVTSQTTVQIADGRLAATVNDRFAGNFICAKMVIAGAILGAIAAALFVAFAPLILGAGVAAGTAMAIGAGAAASGAVAGGMMAMMPSICSMLCFGSQWQPVHPKVLVQSQKALLENSKINCFLGGTVMIFYSEAAAEEFSDLVMQNTFVKVGGIILGSALAASAVSAVLAGSSTFLANTKLVFGSFGKIAGLIYVGEGVAWLGAGWLASGTVDAAKGDGTLKLNVPLTDIEIIDQKILPTGAYELVQNNTSFPMQNYSQGTTVENIDNLTHSNPISIPNFGSADPYADASGIMSDDNGTVRNYDPRISEYETWEHQQQAGLYGGDTNITESNPQNTSTRAPRSRSELNPQVLTDNPTPTHMNDGNYTYVDRVNSRYETGNQLHSTNLGDISTRAGATAKNAVPGLLEWAIDGYNIAMNAILEIPIDEYKKSLEEEMKAKQGITVFESDI